MIFSNSNVSVFFFLHEKTALFIPFGFAFFLFITVIFTQIFSRRQNPRKKKNIYILQQRQTLYRSIGKRHLLQRITHAALVLGCSSTRNLSFVQQLLLYVPSEGMCDVVYLEVPFIEYNAFNFVITNVCTNTSLEKCTCTHEQFSRASFPRRVQYHTRARGYTHISRIQFV